MDTQVIPRTAPASAEEKERVTGTQLVLHKNGLVYRLPQSLSTSVNRTFIKNYAQSQEYKESRTVVFDLNTGSRYIDPERCALIFTVDVDFAGSLDATLGWGSEGQTAAALIKHLLIKAKNGVELDRVDEVNLYSFVRRKFEGSNEEVLFIDSNAGSQQTANEVQFNAAANAPKTYVIPLHHLSGLFRPTVKGMKMPASLLSGARVELTLEKVGRAFTRQAGTVNVGTTYTISDPQIIMMSHELNDMTQRTLNEVSATDGLEYTYPRTFVNLSTSSTNRTNIQVKKAVSQATRVWAISCEDADKENIQAPSFDSSQVIGFDKYQYRVGALFYPQQKVESLPEAQYVSQDAFGSKKSVIGVEDYATTDRVLAASLELDAALNLSGIPINNSSTLEVTLEYTGVSSAHTHYVSMDYIAVSRSFLTNVSVKV